MHAYLVTVLLASGQRRVCAGLHADSATAALTAMARYPAALRFKVLRPSTFLRKGGAQ